MPMYSDFECGKPQRYFEGITKVLVGSHVYEGGRVFKNTLMAPGYSRSLLIESMSRKHDRVLYPTTNLQKLKEITPNNRASLSTFYCYYSGCDFTIRVHYRPQKGLRSYFSPFRRSLSPDYFDPLKPISLQTFVHNIPASKGTPSKYQILFTPLAFNGVSTSNITILLDYTCFGEKESIMCIQSDNKSFIGWLN
ncbi:hypothetical protein CYY_009131 [Polysphondylium violaceum]|uniref:Uncharacterized protein n=1 Tax=Polysphondylium violaceum TaxID=133409 RepID=A0A8J4V3A7_9MYCE|nr:hypothetical protein CYY_009131 [Polysphondylium violaceum]